MPEYVVAIPKEVVDQLRAAVRSALSGQATASSGVNVNAPFWGDENMQLSGVKSLANLIFTKVCKKGVMSNLRWITPDIAKKVSWAYSFSMNTPRSKYALKEEWPKTVHFLNNSYSLNDLLRGDSDLIDELVRFIVKSAKIIGGELAKF